METGLLSCMICPSCMIIGLIWASWWHFNTPRDLVANHWIGEGKSPEKKQVLPIYLIEGGSSKALNQSNDDVYWREFRGGGLTNLARHLWHLDASC